MNKDNYYWQLRAKKDKDLTEEEGKFISDYDMEADDQDYELRLNQ